MPSPVRAPLERPLAAAWILLAITALMAAGLLAVLLVVARTPGLYELLPDKDFFKTALVVHVDLSVLVWFVACAGALWTVAGGTRALALGWIAFGLAAFGTAAMIAAVFVGPGHPSLNNYVPVLRQPTFLIGLGLIGAGFALLVARALVTVWPDAGADRPEGVLKIGMGAAAVIAALAIAVLTRDGLVLPPDPQSPAYFEILTWGAGHVLQFTHALLLLVVWFWLAAATGHAPPASNRAAAGLFVLAAAPVLVLPFFTLAGDPASGAMLAGYTQLMTYGHLALLPLGVLIAWTVWTGRRSGTAQQHQIRYALYASLVLFAAGGLLGFLIRGVNVVVPAHYHGSIVGITLGFMGLTYALLPRLGLGTPSARLVRWQPVCYGVGQLLHIVGLAWSGGYGVQRKVAGAAQGLDGLGQTLGMAVMGMGGLIAVVGGVLFVLACLGAILGRHKNALPPHAAGADEGLAWYLPPELTDGR